MTTYQMRLAAEARKAGREAQARRAAAGTPVFEAADSRGISIRVVETPSPHYGSDVLQYPILRGGVVVREYAMKSASLAYARHLAAK